MENFCAYCGSPLNSGANFCPNCGAPVEHTQKPQGDASRTDQIVFKAEPSSVEEADVKLSETLFYEPDKDIKSMFMRHDNRLNRQRFILRSIGLFVLVTVIAGVLLSIGETLHSPVISLFAIIFPLSAIVPSVKLVIRRLHDLNRPGWWCFGTMIPGVNIVFAVYLFLFVGTNGPNQYGPDPLYEA